MSTVYLSICLCHLHFLSSVPYSFLSYRSFTSLDLYLSILFFFDVIVNGIIFLISPSDSLLLVYRNTTDFYILILYPATLLNSLMSSSSRNTSCFLVLTLGFSMYSIMLSANSDSFTSSFPSWISFISFSCLIFMTRTSNTMLNESGKSGHPCLVPDLRGSTFSFLPLSIMIAMCLSYMAFIMLRYVPSIPTFWRVFIINRC